jgi:hypothetical protein
MIFTTFEDIGCFQKPYVLNCGATATNSSTGFYSLKKIIQSLIKMC